MSIAWRRSWSLVGVVAALVTVATLELPREGVVPAAVLTTPEAGRTPVVDSVLAVSVDGLRPGVIRALGPLGLPNFHRLMKEGASTLSARTAVEMTITLPNHSSMVTGRSIDRSGGGHGVTYNDDRPGTVHEAAGEQVASVFDVVAAAGGRPALFSSKRKFSLFQRSWPEAVDRYELRPHNVALTTAVVEDLLTTERRLRFAHYSAPDAAGHRSGFTSPRYREAARRVDRQLGRLFSAIDSQPALRDGLVIVLTSDHGGSRRGHADPRDPRHYAIPFVVWGAGVAPKGDLYDLTPGRLDPGDGRPAYGGVQPVRNGEVANLALDLLGLPAVPGSTLNVHQDLGVTP